KSFRLLQFLVENRHRVVPKDEILSVVWAGVAVSDNALTRAVAQVRKAIDDDPKEPRHIQTVPTVGYRFIGTVEPVTPAEVPVVDPPSSPIPRAPGWNRWRAALTVLLLAAAGIGFVLYFRRAPEPATSALYPLTTYQGRELFPSFSPDGSQVAFAWDGEHEDNFDIYVKAMGAEKPLRLTFAPETDHRPQWSRDGTSIAFERLMPGHRYSVMLISPVGGPERKLADFGSRRREAFESEFGEGTSWSPDGKWLAAAGYREGDVSDRIYLISVETGEMRPLTNPPAGSLGDSGPQFSPDGRELSFIRSAYDLVVNELHVQPLDEKLQPAGALRRLADGGIRPSDAVWTGDGKELIFTTHSANLRGMLVRTPASGAGPPVQITAAGVAVTSVGLPLAGNRLAYSVSTRDSNIWRLDLRARGALPERLIASTYREVFPQVSPDGRRIVFYSNRSGTTQIWLCDSDGSNARAITQMPRSIVGTPRWSPDGKTISFDSDASGAYQIYTIAAEGGRVRQLTAGHESNFAAGWSRDGKWIYFSSGPSGNPEIRRIPAQGGQSVQVTNHGGVAATESPDGKTLFYSKEPGEGSLWMMPVGGGPETRLSDAIFRYNYAVTDKGVYVTRNGNIDYIDLASGESKTILKTPKPDLGLAISPDGRYLLWAQVDAMGSDLMLIENFH
ncbi:MAG: winged helix-turn-helix domain-containing protein, partial [Acidobacteriota bacterium]